MRVCKNHGMTEFAWHKHGHTQNGRFECMECRRASRRKSHGYLPMSENRNCPQWLGVHVAERALSKFFKHVVRTSSGSPGGDFRCDRNYLIDVKCSCLHFPKGRSPYWMFAIRHNTEADYFLFLLFDDRENLTPMHVMLVPGVTVNHLAAVSIVNTHKGLAKWGQCERPLERVVCCCEQIRGVKA